MKYYVTYKIEARYVAAVEADNLEDALKKAHYEYLDADFGKVEVVDCETVVVEDENGDYIWEK